jgi:hypothetical protein
MDLMKQASRQQSSRYYVIAVLLLVSAFGVSPEAASGQWITSSTNNINNTNTGNVGIGTTAPAAKLDVNGSATFSGTTTVAGRGVFSIDPSNNLNLSMSNHFKINSASIIMNGAFETFDNYFAMRHTPNNSLTVLIPASGSAYFNQGNVGIGTATPNGKLDVVGASGAPNYSTGLTGVLRVGAAQEHIEFGYVTGNRNWIQGFGAVPLYINEGGNNVILNSNAGNVGIGTTAPAYKLHVNGEINATGLRINGTPIGTGGSSQWTTSGTNVYYSTGNIGIGTTAPTTPVHVLSNNANVLVGNISSGYGAIGFQSTLNVNNYALTGGPTETVLNTPTGTALKLRINNSLTNTLVLGSTGNVGIGTDAPTSKLHVIGDITVTGNINAKYQDIAEWVESSQQLQAGMVVTLDPGKFNQVLASSEAYDTKVAGVVSAQPGISLGEKGEGKVLVATTGRVRVRVDAARAPIRIGDLLVTSDVAGIAMRSEPVAVGGRRMHLPGTIIGKALEPLEKGTGEILVLLSLQ